jgi:hypothetical protein
MNTNSSAVQAHLSELLTQSGKYKLTPDDSKLIKQKGLPAYLFAKLSSKKFRKYKMDPEVIDRINFSINTAIGHSQPIPVIFFQGGYKLWRFPSSPNPDWAEFFNLAYVISYIAPLAVAYKPGVELTYYFHTLLMEKHDNLTTEEIESYMDSINYLFDQFSQYLPSNIKLKILRDADFYSRDEYFAALEEGTIKAKEVFETWTPDKIQAFEKMADLNIKWNGKEDWTKLSSQEKHQKIIMAALYEQAAGNNLPKVMENVKAPHKILLFTKSAPIFIGIGSTKTSIAKHWVGFGVLEQDSKGIFERILTPAQYQDVINQPHQTISSDLLSGDNYKQVLVYPRLKF